MMIKKITNWVFGSFFRTMGRFFFFLFFGFLLAAILSKSEIKLTDLLGIETVKAVTYTTEVHAESSSFFNFTGVNTSFTCDDWDKCYTNLISSTTGALNNIEINIDTSYNTINKDVIEFKTIVSQPKQVMGTTAVYYCDTWTQQNSGTYACTNWYNTTSRYYVPVNELGSYSMSAQVQYANTNWSFCDITNGSILCPTYHNQITKLKINYSFMSTDTNTNNSLVRFELYKIANNLYYDKTSSAIENQTEQQQQYHNETMNYFNDTNTTEADSEANNFFENFTSQDNGGISSIITAPLSAISGLVSATCQQIVLPIPYLDNKQLVLPCMSSIYTEHFGSFFTIYQTIIFGAIAYRMLVSIFMMIQGFKNPDDDKIEVVDL